MRFRAGLGWLFSDWADVIPPPLYIHRFRSNQKAYSDVYTQEYILFGCFLSLHPEERREYIRSKGHCLNYTGCVKLPSAVFDVLAGWGNSQEEDNTEILGSMKLSPE